MSTKEDIRFIGDGSDKNTTTATLIEDADETCGMRQSLMMRKNVLLQQSNENIERKIDRIESNLGVIHSQLDKIDKKVARLEVALNNLDGKGTLPVGKFAWIGRTGVCGCCAITVVVVSLSVVFVLVVLAIASLFI
jgi:hypothetical protein